MEANGEADVDERDGDRSAEPLHQNPDEASLNRNRVIIVKGMYDFEFLIGLFIIIGVLRETRGLVELNMTDNLFCESSFFSLPGIRKLRKKRGRR